MGIVFAANAIWWAFKASSTISKGYLDWEASRRGTTLDNAFEGYWRARGRGETRTSLGGFPGKVPFAADAVVWFTQMTSGFAWKSVREAAIDTAAVGTAGFGLGMKWSLGRRIAATLGIKQSVLGGTIIDAVIDMTGAMLTRSNKGGTLNPAVVVNGILEVIAGNREDLAQATQAAQGVLRASVGLSAAIQPFIGAFQGGGAAGAIGALAAAPGVFAAGVNVFASLLGFWNTVEPMLPETPAKPKTKTIVTDPGLRNAYRSVYPIDPGFRGEVTQEKVPVGRRVPAGRAHRHGLTDFIIDDIIKFEKDDALPPPPGFRPPPDAPRRAQFTSGFVHTARMAGILEQLKKG